MTRPDFTRCMAVLLAAFPKLQPDQATVEVWYGLLQDLAPSQLDQAVLAFCRTQREIYPGTNVIATLRDLAIPANVPSASEAWAELMIKILTRYDNNEMLLTKQLSPLVKATVDQIGLTTLLQMDRGYCRSDFMKTYDAMRSSHRHEQLVNQASITNPRVKALIDSAIPNGKVIVR